ncbi:MAG: Ig-like domain-containing protein [Lachnospiraceae bacterium]|nr:Ig-like domain-containing protein [Lachnospiraceae bacterium]
MKVKSRIVAGMLAFVMLFSTASIPVSAAKVTVKKVSVASSLSGSEKTVVVAKGKSVKLKTTVTVTPSKKANKKVSYSVKDKSIATVSNKGVVKGKKAGTTKITVTSSKNKKKKATITVKVMTDAVKSVKLNQKKASLNVGKTLKLKATVSAAKGADKTIAYTSSNTKIAKVNKKGVITAVGTGNATITAKAIDGSGKKATCKVTVANPINLAGISIPNERTINFKLDKACALNPSQVAIVKKKYVSGTYNNPLTINNMTTADNVNYTVVLSADTGLSIGDFVQLAIPSLTGTVKSLETEYKQQVCAFTGETISRWTKGTYSTQTFSFGEDNGGYYGTHYNGGYGYASYSLNGLPAGLTYEVKNGVVKVKGTPTKDGKFDYVLSATDELGNTLSRTIHFIVGSDTVIAGAANTVYKLIDTSTVSAYINPSFTGGSGSYNYSIISDPQATGATIDKSDGEVHMKASVAGTYTVTVRATDKVDASRFCDINVVCNVKQGIVVGGCLKDAQGNPMNKGYVYFANKNRASLYGTGVSVSVGSFTSTYSAVLEPGVYDIRAEYEGGDIEASQSATYLYSQSLTTSQTGYDIQLNDLYKVALVNSDGSNTSLSRYWYLNHEEAGYGSTIYLKPGTYTLESNEIGSSDGQVTGGDWFNGQTISYTPYKLASSFTVVNAAVQAVVNKVPIGPATTTTRPAAKNTTLTITVGETKWLDASNFYAFRFTPAGTGKYQTGNTNVKFYAMDGSVVPSADGVYNLTAGITYIVGRGEYSDAKVQITQVTE